VWLVGVRDLQFRRRRFLIAVLATSVVFAMTLIMSGMSNGLDVEIDNIVGAFGADSWVVARGASGPFTATKFVQSQDVDTVRDAPGVRDGAAMITARATIGTTSVKDVNLIGFEPGRVGEPELSEGRYPKGSGEVLVDSKIDADVGDTVVISGKPVKVVGKTGDLRYNFGVHTVFMTVDDAQRLSFAGQALASAVVTNGVPRGDLPGLRVMTNQEVASDLERPTQSGKQSIDFIQVLLWVVAAGIIALIVYLTALERVRDFAVLKATGTSNATLFGALAFQAVVLSIAAAAVAVLIALALSPFFPFRIVIPGSAYVLLALVAVVVGTISSLAGLRRAVGVDPAIAFGGA
jgi:putative ABC transport system permease protein